MMKGSQRYSIYAYPACVYRLYSASRELLYIGCTFDFTQRLKEHRKDKAWFAEVSSHTVEWYPTRWPALNAEQAAIKTERPKYNRKGGPPRSPNPRQQAVLGLLPQTVAIAKAQAARSGDMSWTRWLSREIDRYLVVYETEGVSID